MNIYIWTSWIVLFQPLHKISMHGTYHILYSHWFNFMLKTFPLGYNEYINSYCKANAMWIYKNNNL